MTSCALLPVVAPDARAIEPVFQTLFVQPGRYRLVGHPRGAIVLVGYGDATPTAIPATGEGPVEIEIDVAPDIDRLRIALVGARHDDAPDDLSLVREASLPVVLAGAHAEDVQVDDGGPLDPRRDDESVSMPEAADATGEGPEEILDIATSIPSDDDVQPSSVRGANESAAAVEPPMTRDRVEVSGPEDHEAPHQREETRENSRDDRQETSLEEAGAVSSRCEVRHVLLYGDVDPNRTDGPCAWLVDMATMLAARPGTRVTLLAAVPVVSDAALGALGPTAVSIVDPWSDETLSALAGAPGSRDAEGALAVLRAIDARDRYDLLVVRGTDLLTLLCDEAGLAERTLAVVPSQDESAPSLLETASRAFAGIVVQTNSAKAALLRALPDCDRARVVVMPPVTPDVEIVARRLPEDAPLRLAYAGRLTKAYKAREILRAFKRLRADRPDLELHVFGEFDPALVEDETYAKDVRQLLETLPGLVRRGSLPREAFLAALGDMDVAISWRSATLDDSVELSSKILDYANAGLPILMNPAKVHKTLFGTSYEGFVEDENEIVSAFERIVSDPDLHERLSRQSRVVGRMHSRDAGARRLAYLVDDLRLPASSRARPTLLVVCDAPAPDAILALARDWTIDVAPSREVLSQRERLERAAAVIVVGVNRATADLVRARLPGQDFLVEILDLQREMPFLETLDVAPISRILVPSPHWGEELAERLGGYGTRVAVLSESFDTEPYDRQKTEESAYTLGMVGFVEPEKGLSRALDLLALLQKRDTRFVLRLVGPRPEEWEASLSAPRREYLAPLLQRIESGDVAQKIHFDGDLSDMPSWFTRIGYVISMSETEGCHLSVAKGMASGAIPMIANWPGADRVYLEQHVFARLSDMAYEIDRYTREPRARLAEGELCKAYAERFRTRAVADRLAAILAGTD